MVIHHGSQKLIKGKTKKCKVTFLVKATGLVIRQIRPSLVVQSAKQDTPVRFLGQGRSPGEGIGYPLQYSCLENPHGQRSLTGYSPWFTRVGHDLVTKPPPQLKRKGS